MTDTKALTDYFGFDLGDGESAVAWMRAGRRTETQMIELRGRKSVITALASHPEQGLFIGEEACHMTGADWIQTRFKSRYLKDPSGAGALIVMFAREVMNNLVADNRLDSPESSAFFIGCPSGWPQDVRAAYKKLFERAGMVNCEVVSESRAAFMFARESGELRVSDDLITCPTLIIDAGSSTTDFTYVADLSETSIRTGDFGDVSLGAGLLDGELLDLNVRRSPHRRDFEQIFTDYPQYRTRCEFEARRVKEMYFTQARRGGEARAESAVKVYIGRSPLTLDIVCDQRDMKGILSSPLDALGGKSFERAYEAALSEAKQQLRDRMPDTILLTGGASRMPLIEDMAREAFPGAQVLRGLEPEFAIARGLCYALRIDQKTKDFSMDVEKLINSEEMEALVLRYLPDLFRRISVPLTDRLVDDIAPQVFEKWRSGGIKTFDEIGVEITKHVTELLRTDEVRQMIRPAVGEWVLGLRPHIEDLTDPICDKYGLPRTSLRLPESLDIGAAQITLSSDSLIKIDQLKALIDIITGAVMAALLGGGGVALLSTGLPGVIGGFIVGILVGIVGTEAAERIVRKVDLPVGMRRLITPRFFRSSLDKRRKDIAQGLGAQFEKELDPPSEAVRGMVREIALSIERQLSAMMERAALMIH
ncbi:MAG: hypothetical protein IJJ23_09680 [Clostridia bacterium]|nr:hypothetical protein [Clostridia bacterium]